MDCGATNLGEHCGLCGGFALKSIVNHGRPVEMGVGGVPKLEPPLPLNILLEPAGTFAEF